MARTTSNTDLVPKEALDELKALDAQAAKVTKTLEGLLTPVSKLVNELSKTSGSFKALAESEKQLESYTKRYTEAVNEQTRIERQKAQLQQRLADLQSKEAQEVANLRLQIQMKNSELKKEAQLQMQTAKAAQQAAETAKAALEAEKQAVIAVTAAKESYAAASTRAARTTDELAAAVSRVSGYGDLSSYIERSEQGLVNYSTAVNAATSRLAEIGSLQAEYKVALDAGNISQEEYNAKMEQLNAANEQTRASLETVRSEASATGSALQGAAAAAEQAFGELDVRIQEQSKNLVELQLEQQNIRNAIAELDAAYKNHAVTEEEYITRKAQLQALSDSQAVAVKNLTKQIELETTVATTAAGSYANLSAQYSLLKMQINQVGEAEGANVESKRKLEAQAKALYEQMSNLQKATGKHQLDVGKYDIAVQSLTQSISLINPSLGMMIRKIENVGIAKKALIAITTKLSKAMNLGKTAASFLSAGLVGLVAGGVVLAIKMFEKMREKAKKAREEQEAFAKSVGDATGNLVSKYKTLQAQWNSLGEDIDKQKKFIKDHANDFNELGMKVETVNDADRVLVNLSDEVIEVLTKRAKATAILAAAQSKWTEAAIKQAQIDALEAEYWDPAFDRISGRATKILKEISDLKKGVESANSQADDLAKKAFSGMNEADRDQLKLGIGTPDGKDDKKALKEAQRRAEEIAKARIKNMQNEARAQREMQLSLLQESAEYNRGIVDNENAGYQERLDALGRFMRQSSDAVTLAEDNQINDLMDQKAKELGLDLQNAADREKLETMLAEQITTVRQQAERERNTISREGARTREEIAKQEADRIIAEIGRTMSENEAELNTDELENTSSLAQSYASGEMSYEEYQRRKAEIAQEYAKKRFEAEQFFLQQTLDELQKNGVLEKDEVDAINAKIEQANARFHSNELKASIDSNEKIGKSLEEAKRKEHEVILDYMQKTVNVYGELVNFISTLLDTKKDKLDEESKKNEEWADNERERIEELEESGAISKEQADARKAAIDEAEEKREEELEKKKAELTRRQAILEKSVQIAQIAIDTAKAIAKIKFATSVAIAEAWAMSPLTFGQPWAGMAAAQGAVSLATTMASAALQTATILATPIPEYAAGTWNHPGGLALVGDGGRPEVVMTPSGGLFRTPANDTLVDLPAHSAVFPSVEEAMKNLDLLVPSVADAINSLDPLPKVGGRPENRTIVNLDLKPMVEMQSKNNRILNEILFGVNRDRANRRFYTLRANLRHTKTLS